MGYIPKNAEWYIADIVVEIRIEDEPRNVVHTNIVLIHADSPEKAYQKAMDYGKREEISYENSDHKTVKIIFRGLRDLNVICDELEDGAEIIFEENISVSEERIKSWISLKDQLGVFAPIEPSKDTPNYISESIVKALEAQGFSREDLR